MIAKEKRESQNKFIKDKINKFSIKLNKNEDSK